jgi:hypothetical protein
MKITQEMIEDAIDLINKNHTITLLDMPSTTRHELANILTSMVDPEQLTYDFTINQTCYGVENVNEMMRVITEYAQPGDTIYITVQDEDFSEVGSAEWTYMQDGEFAHHVLSDGAGIDLHEKVNELAKQA